MRNHSSGVDCGRDRNLIRLRRKLQTAARLCSLSRRFPSAFLISLYVLWTFFSPFFFLPPRLPARLPSFLIALYPRSFLSRAPAVSQKLLFLLSFSGCSSTPQPHSSFLHSLLPYRWIWMQNTVCSEHLGPSGVWQAVALRERRVPTRPCSHNTTFALTLTTGGKKKQVHTSEQSFLCHMLYALLKISLLRPVVPFWND